MPRSVSLTELLDDLISQRMAEMRVALPGEVVSYNAAKQEADVRPLVRKRLEDADGEIVDEEIPVVPHVPVAHLRGGGFHVSVPLAAGNPVTLIVEDVSHDDIRSGRGTIAPSDRASHHLRNAICYPGGAIPESKELGDPSGSNLVVGEDGGNRVEIESGGTLHLGQRGSSEEFVALADLVKSELDKIKSAYDKHNHGNTNNSTPTETWTTSKPAASNVKAD